ncbi:MAG TPA: YraN family protein [Solirubrobacteraceae bacterium]|nr:YraN family protein [Solirubrobacteraceae bacterium]
MPLDDRRRPSQAPPKAPDPRHELGRLGEQLAAEHLLRRGFRVLARNVRTRSGEIDLIGFDGRTLVFVEVKTSRAAHGPRGEAGDGPLARLKPRQRARLRRQAAAWLCDPSRRAPHAHTIRLDAVGVTVDRAGRLLRLDHVEGAW